MLASEAEQYRERARKCRSLAWGYDDEVGARLIEMADELDARAAAIETAAQPPEQVQIRSTTPQG